MPIETNLSFDAFLSFFDFSTPNEEVESKPETTQMPVTPPKGWGDLALENKEKIALAFVGAAALCAAVYFRKELLSPFTTVATDNRKPLWFDYPKPSPLQFCEVRPNDLEKTASTALIHYSKPFWSEPTKRLHQKFHEIRAVDFQRTLTIGQHYILQGTKNVMGELMAQRKSIADTAQCLRDGCWPEFRHYNATQLEQDWLEEAGLTL